jgi:Tol biopolymer transport system component
MDELTERLRRIEDNPSPDLWTEIIDRQAGRTHPDLAPSLRHRVAAALVAAAIAVAAVSFLIAVFRTSAPQHLPPIGRSPSPVPLRIATGLTPPHDAVVFTASVSRSESEVVYTTLDDTTSTPMTDAASQNLVAGDASWSADGKQVAFVVGHVDSWRFTGDGRLFVMNADGSGLRRLPARAATSPTWSPDGSRIAFVSNQGTALCVINSDGSDFGVISKVHGYYQVPAWSPAGDLIAFQSRVSARQERTAIFMIRADGTHERRVTSVKVNAGSPSWSPDGRDLVYSGPSEELSVLTLSTGRSHSVTTCHLPCVADFGPAWSPDGQHIAFVRQEHGGSAFHLYVLNVATGDATRIAPSIRSAGAPSWRP